jgi:hypothetical protein
MHILRRTLALALVPAGVFGAGALYLHGEAPIARILAESNAFIEPSYIQAGVPFIVRDNYATLLCISTRAGQPLQPFISPGNWPVWIANEHAPIHVQAGVPFTVQDGKGGTQMCISTRSGEPLPPFLAPR